MNIQRENSARIVKQALSFERPDRLPAFDGFWEEFVANWRQERNVGEEIDIRDYYPVDLVVPVAREELFVSQVGELEREGGYVIMNDGWGRRVRTRPGTFFLEVLDRDLTRPGDLDKMTFEPAQLDERYGDLLPLVQKERQSGRAVFVKIGGVFIRSTFFRGETEFLMDLASDESLARAIAEKMGDHLLAVGIESLKRAEAHDFGVWIYDDMCSLGGPMFSPDTFRRIFLPIYKKMIRKLKEAGARWVILHCDGNLAGLLDMIVEAGFDGINPVESAAGLDVVELLEKYRGKLCFVGGVCNTHVLAGGDRRTIEMHVTRIVEAGQDGGLVIGTHSVGPDIPVKDYEVYRKIVATRGAYKG